MTLCCAVHDPQPEPPPAAPVAAAAPLTPPAGARVRLSNLPDDERRAAAADLALKLSQMMGLPDGDGDDDNSGSDNDDASRTAAAADDRVAQQDAVH